MTIVFSAGEASGDQYAAELATRLHRARPELRLQGVGGPRLRDAGVEILEDSSSWGAIGISQALRIAPKVYAGLRRVWRAMQAQPPGVFVPIDFGYGNLRLARVAKEAGWKVLYFIPPGSWRRDAQGRDVVAVSDVVVTPFSWSADAYRAAGADAHWFGHPMKQLASQGWVENTERHGVAILPGSRHHEVELLLPVIADALRIAPPMGTVEFGVAPNLGEAYVRSLWQRVAPERKNDVFTVGDVFGTLHRAEAALVCSGTATLQAALARCPHLILYRLTPGMMFQARLLRVKPKRIGLPNIFLDREAVPELIQDQANPQAIRAGLDSLLKPGSARTAQLAAFDDLDGVLGPTSCLDETTDLIAKMCDQAASRSR